MKSPFFALTKRHGCFYGIVDNSFTLSFISAYSVLALMLAVRDMDFHNSRDFLTSSPFALKDLSKLDNMVIPPEFVGRYAYHFTHIDNLDSIVCNGLLSTKRKGLSDIKHTNVAAASIQARRSTMEVPCGAGGTVHDYVPFYFCTVNPMFLSVLNTRNVDQQYMVFLCVSIDILLDKRSVFTDASANTAVPPGFYSNPDDLSKLDWDTIDSRKWSVSSDDERHKKMAELLVYDHVGISRIKHVVVWNEHFRDQVRAVFAKYGITPPGIGVEPFNKRFFYFTKFQMKKPNDSLVTGPIFFKAAFDEVIDQINLGRSTGLERKDGFPFDNIADTLLAIEDDFNNIAEMAELLDLEVKHNGKIYNVDTHTLEFVQNLKKDKFYKACEEGDRDILLLSGYLLGIGKSPDEGSAKRPYPVHTDYPLDSMYRLVRPLTEEIKEVSYNEIRKICLLVGYQDLVFDIILHKRDKSQLFNLIKDEVEIDMLIAISLARIANDDFLGRTNFKSRAEAIRKQAIEHLHGRI